MANRLNFKLMCGTRIEPFADLPNIAIVGEGAYDADIEGELN